MSKLNLKFKQMKINKLTTVALIIMAMINSSCEKDSEETPVNGDLVINEVYTWSPQKEIDDLDFIELYNNTGETIDLAGFKLWEAGGKEEAFTFPSNTTIGNKERLLIECDKYELHADPTSYPIFGLSKGPDEYVVLADAEMNVIDSIACPSLKELESYGRISDGDEEWMIFAKHTKDAENKGEARQPVTNDIGLFVNEVFTNNQKNVENPLPLDETKDFIELYNSSDVDIDLTGYTMNDDAKKPEKEFSFPAGTIVPAKGFKVFDVYKGSDDPNVPVFGLGKSGDWVFIFNTAGTLIAEIEIPAVESDQIETVGRKTDGGDEIVFFSEVSKGESNNGKASHN